MTRLSYGVTTELLKAPRDWFTDHENLALLWRWLDDRGEAPTNTVLFLEKPWRWTEAWDRMQTEDPH